MRITSVASLVDALREYRLLDPTQLDLIAGALRTGVERPQQLGQELVGRGWLTPYQLSQVLCGQGQDLVLGPYTILEPLGEGGMGQVFKARCQSDGRVVALKVIHKDRRADDRARGRFLREVQAISRLSHPNIVTASDAAEAATAHYFAMEYVEGISLGRIVSRNGPLPIAPACDYIRQAALGLQHAHENGLVHRDVNPSNLLVIPTPSDSPMISVPDLPAALRARFGRWGTVKLFDLGLVLLEQHEKNPETQAKLTRTGFSLGTVDYMAPEQVMDAHRVDIRADLYSLGCTFYELLTGQVPFPEGPPARKLQCHQAEEPRRVEQLRPDLSADLVQVVDKLLAKDPGQRYETPAALAAALSQSMCELDCVASAWDWKPPSGPSHPVSFAQVDELPKTNSGWLLPILIVCVVIALIAVLAAWSFLQDRSRASSDGARLQTVLLSQERHHVHSDHRGPGRGADRAFTPGPAPAS